MVRVAACRRIKRSRAGTTSRPGWLVSLRVVSFSIQRTLSLDTRLATRFDCFAYRFGFVIGYRADEVEQRCFRAHTDRSISSTYAPNGRFRAIRLVRRSASGRWCPPSLRVRRPVSYRSCVVILPPVLNNCPTVRTTRPSCQQFVPPSFKKVCLPTPVVFRYARGNGIVAATAGE